MDTIFTTHPEHIKHILATDFNNFVKGLSFHLLLPITGSKYRIPPGERFQHGMNSVLGVR
jgi:hypothetical protein